MLSGCASLVSTNTWPVTVNSTPDKADVVIVDRKGKELFKGITPTVFHLNSGNGYFRKASYIVKVSMEGFKPVEIPLSSKLNSVYFTNLAFGGVIGMLIVDPITGAMYKLKDPGINPLLTKETSSNEDHHLKIISITDFPVAYRNQLTEIK
jgi:hypothetical protein